MLIIEVTGNRGEGKTITALRIVAYLRSFGFDVQYQGYSRKAEKELEELIGTPLGGSCPRKFLVRDVCTQEEVTS